MYKQLLYNLPCVQPLHIFRLLGNRRLQVQIRTKIALLIDLQSGIIQLKTKNETALELVYANISIEIGVVKKNIFLNTYY